MAAPSQWMVPRLMTYANIRPAPTPRPRHCVATMIAAPANQRASHPARPMYTSYLRLPLRQPAFQAGADHLAVLAGEVPVNGAMQAIHELDLRLPVKELPGEGVVGHAVERARGHLRVQLDPGLVARVAKHLFHRVDDTRPLRRAEVHRCAVVDLLCRQDGAAYDVAHVGPVPDLRPRAPHHEGVLSHEGAGDHGNDRMILVAAVAVHGELSTRGRPEPPILVEGAKGHLPHQLGPPVEVVSVVGWSHHLLGQVKHLVRIALQV